VPEPLPVTEDRIPKPVEDMTDRELLEELVTSFREFNKQAGAFVAQMSNNPMLKAFMG
jgi:hypothetical protein